MIVEAQKVSYGNCLNRGHPEQIIWMGTHAHNFRNDDNFRPLDAEYLR